jgi:hypothetical protein
MGRGIRINGRQFEVDTISCDLVHDQGNVMSRSYVVY